MTCERHYDTATVADLQQIAAGIEAERRRQYRAEMAQELRHRLAIRRYDLAPYRLANAGRWAELDLVERLINELSPPVVCDETEEA